jgi:hypothetical protein
MLSDPIWKENGELEEHLTPVLDTARPFANDVHGGEIEHFKKGFIRRKYALPLRHFTKLAMVALDDVRRVDELTDLRRVLKEGRQLVPIITPGTDDEGVLRAPDFRCETSLRNWIR